MISYLKKKKNDLGTKSHSNLHFWELNSRDSGPLKNRFDDTEEPFDEWERLQEKQIFYSFTLI